MDPRAAQVVAGFDRLNTNDPDGYLRGCSDDLWVRSNLGDIDGRDNYLAFMTAGFEAIPDHWRRLERVVSSGDTVAAVLVFGGTSPVTGQSFQWDAITLFHFADEQIVGITEHGDPRLARAAFGLPEPTGANDAPGPVVTAALDRLNAHDIEGYVAACADDVVSTTPLAVARGRAELRRYFDGAFASLSHHATRIDCLIENGDTVATLVKFGATVAATNDEFEIDFVTIFTVRDGLIATITEYGSLPSATRAPQRS